MLAKEYAKAIFEVVSDQQSFHNDFKLFFDALNENKEYIKLMDSKAVSKEKKKELLSQLVKEDLLNFSYVLIDNNRFNLIFDIYSEYRYLLDEKEGIMRLNVTSFDELSNNSKLLIINHFENEYKKKIVINVEIDNSLLSGIKVTFLGKLLDVSMINRLLQMKHKLFKEVL